MAATAAGPEPRGPEETGTRATTSGASRQGVLEVAAVVVVAAALISLAVAQEPWVRAVAGGALAVGSATHLAVRGRWRGLGEVARLDLLGAVVGLALMVSPVRGYNVVTFLAGAAVVLLGLAGAVETTATGGTWRRLALRAAVLVPVGIALLLVSSTVVEVGLWAGAAVLLADAAVAAAQQGGRVAETTDPRPRLLVWLTSRASSDEDRARVVETVFLEGDQRFSLAVRFALMMTFASVISAMGVIGDSTAVVIGAMLIAPLINPMMGMGLALVMGWPARLAQAGAAVLAGVVISVGSGWLLAAALDVTVDLETNTQVLSRSSPTLSDLVVAVAAGAAGGYVLSRTQVSSSLPGVAIAIALVPPLSVVGVTAEQGSWAQAAGTSLLFLTNLVAILIVGGVVFVLTGIAPSNGAYRHQRLQVASAAVVALALFVWAALSVNSASVVQQDVSQEAVRGSVLDWLGGSSDFTLVSLEVDGPVVTVVLAGPGDPPDSGPLARAIAIDLDEDVRLDLQWIARERRVTDAEASDG